MKCFLLSESDVNDCLSFFRTLLAHYDNPDIGLRRMYYNMASGVLDCLDKLDLLSPSQLNMYRLDLERFKF